MFPLRANTSLMIQITNMKLQESILMMRFFFDKTTFKVPTMKDLYQMERKKQENQTRREEDKSEDDIEEQQRLYDEAQAIRRVQHAVGKEIVGSSRKDLRKVNIE